MPEEKDPNKKAMEDLLGVLEEVQKEEKEAIKEQEEEAKIEEEEVVESKGEETKEEKEEEEKTEEPPKEEEEDTEGPDLATENIRLREMLNELARKVGGEKATPPIPLRPEEEKAAEKSEAVKEAVQVLADFITDEEADLLIDKPKEVLSKVLGRVASSVREAILRDLPPIVGNVAQQSITMWRKVEKFYEVNKDLDEYRDFVRMVGVQVEAENPDWTVDKIYDETAKIARARLGLKSRVKQTEDAQSEEPRTKPALPSSRSSRKPGGGPKLSKDQEAMVDMLALDNQ